MTTPAELLRAFHSIDSSRKVRSLRIVDEELLPEQEEAEQVVAVFITQLGDREATREVTCEEPVSMGVSVSEDTAIRFIARHFDVDQAALATDDRCEKFRSLVRDNQVVIAAKECEELTGASLPECHLATMVAKGPKQLPS